MEAYLVRNLTLIGMLLMLLFSGCGPIYSTEYRLTPPTSSRGLDCIDGCEDDADDCRNSQRDSKERCEDDNQRLVDDCVYRLEQKKGRGPKWTECGRQLTCDYPESKCEDQFHRCYRSCGGEVKEEKICVMNCDELKKGP